MTLGELRAFQFISLMVTALTLIAPGAHLASLANKISLSKDVYYTVQTIYRGWWLLGLVMIAAVITNATLALMLKNNAVSSAFAWAAAGLIVLALVIFFIWIFPANQTTHNWTKEVANWKQLRTRWEYAHGVNALLQLAAFGCTAWANVHLVKSMP